MSLVLLQSFCLGKDHAFLYVEVMWRESSRRAHVLESLGRSGGISSMTCTVSTG